MTAQPISVVPVVGTKLVDLDVTIRVIESELPVPATLDPEVCREVLRDYLANRVRREFSGAATIAVNVVVREV